MKNFHNILLHEFKERELEILSLMAAGYTNAAIAQHLFITKETVRWYNKQIYSKLGTSRRTEAIARARQLGLIDDQITTSPSTLSHNLPAIATPFLGRNHELATLSDLLNRPHTPLVTIVGPGGMGKTRLAIELGHHSLDKFTDGVYLFELAALTQADAIVNTVLQTLELTSQNDADAKQTVFDYCRNKKQMLFIFDNFEHLLDGSLFLNELIQVAPNLRVLVTSRERLNFYGEMVYRLTGLRRQATDLFMASAQASHANVQIEDNERDDVQRIVKMVGGMPLAIILAAAWVDLLPPHEIAEELSRDLDLLTTKMRNVPERQRSIRAVLAATWQKLSTRERSTCMNLSVFRGGFSRRSAKQVAGASLPLLATLVDKSLLRRNDAGRYELHELLRQYAAEKLNETGETDQVRDRHLAFFFELASEAEPKLQGIEQALWLKKLNAENGNLHAALTWSLAGGDAEMGLRLATKLSEFWFMRGYLFGEGRAWLERVLSAVETPQSTKARAKAYRRLGTLAESQGDYGAARSAYEQSLALYRELRDKEGIAASLHYLGETVALHENEATARPLFAAARSAYEESLTSLRQQGDQWRLALSFNSIGEIARLEGDYTAARSFYEQSLALRRKLGDTRGIAVTLINLGFVVLYLGNIRQATIYIAESLPLFQKLGNTLGAIDCLTVFASVLVRQGRLERAARLFGAEEALRETSHLRLEYVDRVEKERYIVAVQTQLDETTFAAAWAEGRQLTMEQAIECIVIG